MEEVAKEMPVTMSDIESNVGPKSKDVMTQTVFTDHEVYMWERIQETEQEVKELKGKLEEIQRKNAWNLKSRETGAAFYSGFPNWDTFILFTNILILEICDRISPTGAS